MKTAILVDGAFYRQKAEELFGYKSAEDRARELFAYCLNHLNNEKEARELYRIFYYDCPPIDKKVYHPLKKADIELKQSNIYNWMNTFLEELTKKRRVALRLGRLAKQATYTLQPSVVKELLDSKKTLSDLTEADFFLDVKQKGVDMRIGLDISSIAYKRQVDQIILIAGDSDFVPAAKHARREGIDFILDNMGHRINPDLHEHIDGLETHYKDFQKKAAHSTAKSTT